MSNKEKGKLYIIGGHENTEGDRVILDEVCKGAKKNGGQLVLVTVASQEPEKMAEKYIQVFRELGITDVKVMDIRNREQAENKDNLEKLKDAPAIFFTGGDQMRITSQVGDSDVYQRMREIFSDGGIVAGTSAGAAAMPETMIVGGPSEESNSISALSMAPGLGLIQNVIIDSHFAQRGRIGRLLGAVVQNPRNLGLGIDEDTAIVTDGENEFRVIGSGAVYVLDGSNISYSSLSEKHSEGIISIFDVKMHVLGEGDRFDLKNRKPIIPDEEKANQKSEATENQAK